MKKLIVIIIVVAACSAAAFGQTSAVVLQNQEGSPFYYVMDPKELAGLTAGSPMLASKVADFFAAAPQGDTFAQLAPDAQVRLQDLSDGTHLLVGFFAPEGLTELPVRVISVQADSRIGDRFYAIFASPSLLSVPRGLGRLAQFAQPPRGSQAAAATETQGAQQGTAAGQQGASTAAATSSETTAAANEAASAAVSTSEPLQLVQSFEKYTPTTFTEERQNDFQVLPLEKSQSWGHTGTRVQGLWGLVTNGNLRLAISVSEGFSEKVSYFFYIFPGPSPQTVNPLTLELEPRANGIQGACLLWKQGETAPQIIGSVRNQAGTVELDISASQMASDILAVVGDSPSIDLTAGWFDRAIGTWEEFYYGTFTAAQIPAIR
jgi:hypothetical protein